MVYLFNFQFSSVQSLRRDPTTHSPISDVINLYQYMLTENIRYCLPLARDFMNTKFRFEPQVLYYFKQLRAVTANSAHIGAGSSNSPSTHLAPSAWNS